MTTLLLSLTLSASKARQLHVGLRGGSSTRERVRHPWHRPHPRPAVPWASEITSLPPPTTFLEPGAAAQALQPQDPREVQQLWVGPVERLAGSIAFSPDRGEKGFPSPAGPQIHQDSRPSKPQAPSPRGRLGGRPPKAAASPLARLLSAVRDGAEGGPIPGQPRSPGPEETALGSTEPTCTPGVHTQAELRLRPSWLQTEMTCQPQVASELPSQERAAGDGASGRAGPASLGHSPLPPAPPPVPLGSASPGGPLAPLGAGPANHSPARQPQPQPEPGLARPRGRLRSHQRSFCSGLREDPGEVDRGPAALMGTAVPPALGPLPATHALRLLHAGQGWGWSPTAA